MPCLIEIKVLNIRKIHLQVFVDGGGGSGCCQRQMIAHSSALESITMSGGGEDVNVVQESVQQSRLSSQLTFQCCKAGKYRDTVSVEPGSRQIFDSVSVSKSQFLGIFCTKDTFCLY